jgi:PPOX class probable F420-dependent enzyme
LSKRRPTLPTSPPTRASPIAVELSEDARAFVTERHLATLTLVRPDGRPHVTPVGFTWDAESGLARVITWSGSRKAALLTEHGSLAAALSQVDGGRWLTLSGPAVVSADPARCREGVRRYAERYRPPGDRGDARRVIEVAVDHVMGSV